MMIKILEKMNIVVITWEVAGEIVKLDIVKKQECGGNVKLGALCYYEIKCMIFWVDDEDKSGECLMEDRWLHWATYFLDMSSAGTENANFATILIIFKLITFFCMCTF